MDQGNSITNEYRQWSTALSDRIPQGWLDKVGWVTTKQNTTDDPVDILDNHAQRLVVGDPLRATPRPYSSSSGGEIESLTYLAEQVAYVVCPASPTARYRKELRQALLSSHRQQAAQRRIFAHPLFEKGVVDRSLLERMEIKSPWFWQVAAALPILLSAAVIIWHYTHRTSPPAEKLAAQ